MSRFLGIGHPEQSISEYNSVVYGSLLSRLISFIENKTGRSFEHSSQATWSMLACYPADEVISNVKGRGISALRLEELRYTLNRTKLWNKPAGTRTVFGSEELQDISNNFENEHTYQKEMDESSQELTFGLSVKNKHKNSLLRILERSDHIDAKEMLAYMRERLQPEGCLIEEEIQINWEKSTGGYYLTTGEDFSPNVMVIDRWDAKLNGHNVTLVRQSIKLGFCSYSAYINIDSNPIKIAVDIRQFKDANRAVMSGLQKLYPSQFVPHVTQPSQELLLD